MQKFARAAIATGRDYLTEEMKEFDHAMREIEKAFEQLPRTRQPTLGRPREFAPRLGGFPSAAAGVNDQRHVPYFERQPSDSVPAFISPVPDTLCTTKSEESVYEMVGRDVAWGLRPMKEFDGVISLTLAPSVEEWLSHWEDRLTELLLGSESCVICLDPLITARRAKACRTCGQAVFHWSCRERCLSCPLCRYN